MNKKREKKKKLKDLQKMARIFTDPRTRRAYICDICNSKDASSEQVRDAISYLKQFETDNLSYVVNTKPILELRFDFAKLHEKMAMCKKAGFVLLVLCLVAVYYFTGRSMFVNNVLKMAMFALMCVAGGLIGFSTTTGKMSHYLLRYIYILGGWFLYVYYIVYRYIAFRRFGYFELIKQPSELTIVPFVIGYLIGAIIYGRKVRFIRRSNTMTNYDRTRFI